MFQAHPDIKYVLEEEEDIYDMDVFKIYKIKTEFQKILSMHFYQQKVVYIRIE